MAENLSFFPDKRLIRIEITGVSAVADMYKNLAKIEQLLSSTPKPEIFFADFTTVTQMPDPESLVEFAQHMAQSKMLRDLKIILLLGDKQHEDLYVLDHIGRLRGVNFNFYFERDLAMAAIQSIIAKFE